MMMDFAYSPGESKLRESIADFARNELPDDVKDGSPDMEAQFHGRLWEVAREIMPKAGARGWLGPSWPVEYGGKAGTATDQVICYEELAYWGIPGSDMGIGGISWIGPSLLAYGSKQQKAEHLPYLTGGRRFWCTAYSEPGSGSDMASMQSSAIRKGTEYVINGQKVWTSCAPIADWCWLLVRTNPDVPKHKGLSLFVLDVHTKGFTVSPLPAMTGTTPFAELFFDDVHIPASSLIGEENRGWNYVVAALDFERASVGILFSGILRRLLDELLKARKAFSPNHRNKLAELALDIEVNRMLAYRSGSAVYAGRPSNVEAAESKMFSTELSQKAAQVAIELMGLYGQLGEGARVTPLIRRIHTSYLSCMGNTILAGTSEIERNVIAQRGLGLPR